jgi:F-type H+-transporting ATPase subunit alpha
MDLDDQVIILFAGVNGFTDKIPVERLKEYQAGLLRFIETSNPEIGKDIQKEKRITKETESKLRDSIQVFNSTWK